MSDLPSVIFNKQELVEAYERGGELEVCKVIRNQIIKTPTPSEYVKMKDKFPYVVSTYLDDSFKKTFPIYETDLVSRTEDPYNINYTIKLTAIIPIGDKLIRISNLGAGGSIKQVKTDAKKKFINEGVSINPFDYVSNSNADKAALTLAIANAESKFGFAADMYEKIILSSEELKGIEDTITTIIDKYIINPKDKIKSKEKQDNLKSIKDKLEFLRDLREEYPESEELFKEER